MISTFFEAPNDDLDKLPTILARSFFPLREPVRRHLGQNGEAYTALQLQPKDWPVIEKINASKSDVLAFNMLRLVSEYISTNKCNVHALIKADSVLGKSLFELDTDAIADQFINLSDTEKQSLFAFKLYSALFSEQHQIIVDYFAESRHSAWVKQRFLYPMVFKYVNIIDDSDFYEMVDTAIPDIGLVLEEKNSVTYFLQDVDSSPFNLAAKCYLALLAHPFDALNMIIAHYEIVAAKGLRCPPNVMELLNDISLATGSGRLKNLCSYLMGERPEYSVVSESLPIATRLMLSEPGQLLLKSFFINPDIANAIKAEDTNYLIEIWGRLRFDRYPREQDFNDIIQTSRRYGFSEVGRLFWVMLTSIYMVERSDRIIEKVHLLRQMDFLGFVTPFLVASPYGAMALSEGFFGEISGIDDSVSQYVERMGNDSRWWIKGLHWRLRDLELKLKITEWLKEIRKSIRLSGNSRFLSGVDWSWIDEVVSVARIKPFAGSWDGIYVLLLRAMEQRQREPNALRLAMMPIVAKDGGVLALVKILRSEYKGDTTAFIRFFLTPAMILKMRLEANYMAAVSARLDALESVVSEFGFSEDVMRPDEYEREQKTLATILTFMAVGAAQFEISWDVFRADAMTNSEDSYRAHIVFNKTYNNLNVLSESKRTISHSYSNKEIKTYEYRNKDFPLVAVILSVIDTFLSHPSYGIESILAIRIRHDNLRREYAVALSHLKRIRIAQYVPEDHDECLARYEAVVNSTLQAWVDAYMHTGRGAASGIFDFTVSQVELDELVRAVPAEASKGDIVDLVVNHIRIKLESCLDIAREKLRSELIGNFRAAMSAEATLMRAGQAFDDETVERTRSMVETVVQQKSAELVDWFRAPPEARRKSLSIHEIKLAAEGRFADDIAASRLILTLNAPQLAEYQVQPEFIRPMFDIWSELIMNALKYSGKRVAVVRVQEVELGAKLGLRFSTLCELGPTTSAKFEGQPHAADELMLTRGKSGLKKVAALAAAILGVECAVYVERKKRSFHTFVPILEVNNA